MLLSFAANYVNHCVWRDSRVILSNQKSVFTNWQLAQPGQSHQCCKTALNVGSKTCNVTAMSQRAEELSRDQIASRLCLRRLLKPSCDRVTNLVKYYPMLRKTALRASFVVCVATAAFPSGFGAKNKEP